jgi:NAD(P)-dependent dehydrogenase (short-subunit alcohol dehydrogenase family)
MPSLAEIRASNSAFTHSSHPVAVFVGGTSGIGEGMARVFAEHTKGDSDVIIVGRNRASAENIFSILPLPTSTSTSDSDKSTPAREFVQCDVTSMTNVQEATRSILTKYPKINYLVMSPGTMTLAGRDETGEGIDKKLAVHYYGGGNFSTTYCRR